jgi:hypothetical protein
MANGANDDLRMGNTPSQCCLIRGLLRHVTPSAYVEWDSRPIGVRWRLGYSTEYEGLRTVNAHLRIIIRFHGISGKFGIASVVRSD